MLAILPNNQSYSLPIFYLIYHIDRTSILHIKGIGIGCGIDIFTSFPHVIQIPAIRMANDHSVIKPFR